MGGSLYLQQFYERKKLVKKLIMNIMINILGNHT